MTSAATIAPSAPPTMNAPVPNAPRDESLGREQREVGARVEPGERERHALEQHGHDRSDQAGRHGHQPDQPLRLVGHQHAGDLEPHEEPDEADEQPEELAPREQQHDSRNHVDCPMHRRLLIVRTQARACVRQA
jgi:hypothetical protein